MANPDEILPLEDPDLCRAVIEPTPCREIDELLELSTTPTNIPPTAVIVVTDAHTLSDRPHLDARSVIRHHHWVWSNLISERPVRLAQTDELLI